MSIRTKIFLTIISFLFGANASADVKEDIIYLSDEVCDGRKSGTIGAVEASWYIMKRFRDMGLEPVMQAYCRDMTDDSPDTAAVGHNIVCEIPGKDPAIVFTAHYDGFGSTDGQVNPGADANGSGVAALLYLAGQLKDCGRHLVFAALDGHHDGLAGAKALKMNLKKTKIRMVMNLETLGSDLSPVKPYYRSYFIVLGGILYKKQLEEMAKDTGLKLYYDYYGSPEFTRLFLNVLNDQAVFTESGVPAVMFTSGVTANSGNANDRPQTLNYEMLDKRLSLIENFAKALSK